MSLVDCSNEIEKFIKEVLLISKDLAQDTHVFLLGIQKEIKEENEMLGNLRLDLSNLKDEIDENINAVVDLKLQREQLSEFCSGLGNVTDDIVNSTPDACLRKKICAVAEQLKWIGKNVGGVDLDMAMDDIRFRADMAARIV